MNILEENYFEICYKLFISHIAYMRLYLSKYDN